ncbi:hypothetical protein BSKO_03709 [Bryopsis sp. KO-2023]|nr:hypothetical protein BSKO_03709 [Bryopsis sp. KO-2023]
MLRSPTVQSNSLQSLSKIRNRPAETTLRSCRAFCKTKSSLKTTLRRRRSRQNGVAPLAVYNPWASKAPTEPLSRAINQINDTCKQETTPKLAEEKVEEKGITEHGSVLGAIFLITGSTVGAGMLALPAATAGGGFLPSAGVMSISWALLTLESLLIAEVNMNVMKTLRARGENPDTVVSLSQMAGETLGPVGAKLSTFVYLFLSYTLLVAYVSKGGELVNLLSADTLPAGPSGAAFAVALGIMVTFGSTKAVDVTNRFLTGGLVALFGALVFGGAQIAQWDTLLIQQDWGQAWGALPIVFLSLVFHDLVPVLCKYLGYDKSRVRAALVLGGAIPLGMFLAWDSVALAMVPGAAEVVKAGGTIDPLRVLIETQGSYVGTGLEVFSLLAIVTSFIGTSLGLTGYMLSEIKGWQSKLSEGNGIQDLIPVDVSKMDENARKAVAMSLVLIPPSVAASINPNLFFTATQIAGAYGMTLLYGIMPPLMAWCVRHPIEGHSPKASKKRMVPGGRPVLASLASCAAALEVGKLAKDSGAFISGLTAVGTQVQSAANLVISDLASTEGMAQFGQAFDAHHMM